MRPLAANLHLNNTVDTAVDRLGSFAAKLTRVARKGNTDGTLGGQAGVEGVAGTWTDRTHSADSMAGNLIRQVRNIAVATTAVARGDVSRKITIDVKATNLELGSPIGVMVAPLDPLASGVTRLGREAGTEEKLGGQADVKGVAGTWKDLTDSVDFMAASLGRQVRTNILANRKPPRLHP